MTGHLHLTAAVDPATGRTALREQSFRAPMHIGKGHWTGARSGLTVHAVNATAGMFAGDRVDWRVRVGAGARLRVVSPSAARVFRHARPGAGGPSADARTEHAFEVAAGGRLEVWPEGFIPHAGCRHEQATRLDVAAGGTALLCEVLAPGRVASGEAWAFERLRSALDIAYAGRPVVRERWDLRPRECPASLAGWRLEAAGLFRSPPFYASLFLIGAGAGAAAADLQPRADEENADRPARTDADPDHWIGASRLADDAGWGIKVLAADGAILRRVLARLRQTAVFG